MRHFRFLVVLQLIFVLPPTVFGDVKAPDHYDTVTVNPKEVLAQMSSSSTIPSTQNMSSENETPLNIEVNFIH
jgi:hypothetical protein